MVPAVLHPGPELFRENNGHPLFDSCERTVHHFRRYFTDRGVSSGDGARRNIYECLGIDLVERQPLNNRDSLP